VIFPEALESPREFEAFRQAVSVPLLANMNEFGKSPLLSVQELEDLGYNLVIYPVTGLRLAMQAVEDGLAQLKRDGMQQALVPQMQTRKRLYELVKYERYAALDRAVFNFGASLEPES
jgi:methylisocitrate lyase